MLSVAALRSAYPNIVMEVFVKEGDDYEPLPEDHVVLSKSELASKYKSADEYKEGVAKAVKDRLSNHVNLDSAHENETVISRVLEAHGKPATTEEERKRWEQAHLIPERQKREEMEERATRLSDRVKLAEMERVFTEAGFSKAWTRRPAPDKPSPAEIYVGGDFDLDDNASLVVKDTGVSPVEFAKQLTSNEAYALFLEPDPSNASRTGRPGQDKTGNKQQAARTTQRSLTGPAKAEYIEKHGYATPKFDGAVPFTKLDTR